jgi:hypothetical protein
MSLTLVSTLLVGFLAFVQSGYSSPVGTSSVSLESGFHEMYSLDFSEAHKTFAAWQELHPDDPLGSAADAAVYLFAEFQRLNVLQLDLFTDKKGLDDRNRIPPDPAMKDAFLSELAKADGLADKVLAHAQNDCDALFAKTFTAGLRGNYAALIEKESGSGLNFLKSSRATAEKLVAIDPSYYDAYLAIGIENYVLGNRSAPTRWMLRLSGAQTDKNKGIDSLKITAEKGRFLGPYARLLLTIAALRDHDQKTAKKLLADLAKEFPENQLYQTELSRLQS